MLRVCLSYLGNYLNYLFLEVNMYTGYRKHEGLELEDRTLERTGSKHQDI